MSISTVTAINLPWHLEAVFPRSAIEPDVLRLDLLPSCLAAYLEQHGISCFGYARLSAQRAKADHASEFRRSSDGLVTCRHDGQMQASVQVEPAAAPHHPRLSGPRCRDDVRWLDRKFASRFS